MTGHVYAPVPVSRDPTIADRLFLLAHNDQTGAPLTHLRLLGTTVAAAVLAEAMTYHWINDHEGNVLVVQRVPEGFARGVPDPARIPEADVMTWLLAMMCREPAPLTIRDWLEYLTPITPERVARRLILTGWVRSYGRRGVIARQAQPVFPAPVQVAQVAVAIREQLRASALTALDAVLLALLARTAGLGDSVLWLGPDEAAYLDSRLPLLPRQLHALLGDTRAAAETTVVTRR